MSRNYDDDVCPTCHGYRALGWCPQCNGDGFVIEDPVGSRQFRSRRVYENQYSEGSRTCPKCNGGRAIPCPECRGTGRRRY